MDAKAELFLDYCRAYSQAVIAYLKTDQPQTLVYLVKERRFIEDAVDEGAGPEDVGLWIGSEWQMCVGTVASETDTSASGFSPKALDAELVQKLRDSDHAKQDFKYLLNRHSHE